MTFDIFKVLYVWNVSNLELQVMQAPFLLTQSTKLHNDSMWI